MKAVLVVESTSPESVEAVGLIVMAIITAACDEKTKRVALEVLSKGIQPVSTSINNCNFSAGELK